MKTEPIPCLTGLRLVAALSVILSHGIPAIVKYDDPPLWLHLLATTSGFGMTLFFVLSGFVIYLNYSDRVSTGTDLWNFFVARFARLYPLFALCVAYDIAIRFSYDQLPPRWSDPLIYYAFMAQSWFYTVIDGHSLIFQNGRLSPVTWSISTEWGFYFAFPLLCLSFGYLNTATKRLSAIVGLMIVGITIAMAVNMNGDKLVSFGINHFGPVGGDNQDGFFPWLGYYSPYTRVLEFTLGCLCALFYSSLRHPPSQVEQTVGVWVTLLTVLALIAFHWLIFGHNSSNVYFRFLQALHRNFGYAPGVAVLIFCCARYRSFISDALSSPLVVLGGEVSYSSYLLHLIVINAFRYEAAKITSWQVSISSYAYLIIAIAAIFGLSLISWQFVEMPARRFLKRWLSIKPPRQLDIVADDLARSGARG